MKHQVKNTVRAIAAHVGLKVKFVDYFDDQTQGKLLVREKRILLNAHKPRTEHLFTILHEIGHFLLHHLNPPRDYCPWYLRKHWNSHLLEAVFFKARRSLRFLFNRTAGKEWEADVWALCAFLVLARQTGCRTDLIRFLDRHPEKLNSFLLVAGAVAYTDAKSRLINFSKRLLLPFRPA